MTGPPNDGIISNGHETRHEGSMVDEPKYSKGDRRQRAAYHREFVPGMVAYAVALAVVLPIVDDAEGALRSAVLIPLLPILWVGVAVVRSLQRADEYARLLQYRAMACGFAAAALASLTLGLLGVVGVATVAAGWIVFGVAMSTWGVALGVLSR